MKFRKLYDDNRKSVIDALIALWCGELATPSQLAQGDSLEQLVKKQMFSPTDTWPLVQCMNSWTPAKDAKRAKDLVHGLWTSKFTPYRHQAEAWEALQSFTPDGRPKSMCVTTGTGSGKTECFMLPLVDDLRSKDAGNNRIKALFLYPLNALMEDQKERLQDLIKGTGLKFAVYNSELPEKWPEPGSPHYDEVIDIIATLQGWEKDKQGNYVKDSDGKPIKKYPDLIATREDLRNNPPDILLTNPTMLEYILLRRADERLIDPLQQSLRWVVIDETHTYTGAGATEMAMLLRRVLQAFDVDAKTKVRFATSSATFGNGHEATEKLRTFIADMTGTTTDQVEVIGGTRIGYDAIPAGRDERVLKAIFDNDFISLKELYPDAATIEEGLERLDALCDRCAQQPIDEYGNPLLRVKAHFFYRVPNNGIYARLTEHNGGAFKIHPFIPREETDDCHGTPLLEMGRCKNCGEYLAIALYNEGDETYTPVEFDEEDMFDLERQPKNNQLKYAAICLSKGNELMEGNLKMSVSGDKLVSCPDASNGGWHLMVNTACRCPSCGKSLTKTHGHNDSEGFDPDTTEESGIKKIRVSAEFISRVLAPSILDNVQPTPVTKINGGLFPLHDGQQFLSFADSRQMAAQSTLNQNIEQEKMWVYSTIYHELNQRAAQGTKTKSDYMALATKAMAKSEFEKAKEYIDLATSAPENAGALPVMSWMEVAALLKKHPYFETFCTQFLRRGPNSDEMNHGKINEDMRNKYVHSIMAQYLAPHPKSAQSPENLGLFHACYPQIESVTLPDEVVAFNESISNPSRKISEQDWRNLLTMFMDYRVRVNQSFCFKMPGKPGTLDIFDLVRFASQKPHRRPVAKPRITRTLPQTMIIRYLAALIADSTDQAAMAEAYRNNRLVISRVIDALWRDLTDTTRLIEIGWVYNENATTVDKFERERGRRGEPEPWRLNLVNMSFTLFGETSLVDTNTISIPRATHIPRWRPTWVEFKNFSPYMINRIPQLIKQDKSEQWSPYRHETGATSTNVKNWARKNRKILWENGLWGENGTFSDRLEEIHCMPKLFIQAEHTAQVDKAVSRRFQEDFKKHYINILACSTTMEMGVDLGSLEAVLLNSVPPSPANYKQRSGRSGRAAQVRSVCITLCSSDAVGLAVLNDAMATIINRPVEVPTVDLESRQVIQRHANAFLIRAFNLFGSGSISQKVIDFYTPFKLDFKSTNSREKVAFLPDGITEALPTHRLGDYSGTLCRKFDDKCKSPDENKVVKPLRELLRGTGFDVYEIIQEAAKANKICYGQIQANVEYLKQELEANSKRRNFLVWKYNSLLKERLIDYWAKNRFTPNANMPVNVISFEIYNQGRSSNVSLPSYGLREALAQYCPGNTVTIDGVVYPVQGVEPVCHSGTQEPFRKLYRNNNECRIDDDNLDPKIQWTVNGYEGLEMVTPASFIPDEDRSRIVDKGKFTQVSSQLIGTTSWPEDDPNQLVSFRTNRETTGNILYYNKGVGYGFCMCSWCHRIVIEEEPADKEDKLSNLPVDFNPLEERTENDSDGDNESEEQPVLYHRALRGKMAGKKCLGSNTPKAVHRNVIIGDKIQTDFCEIKIRPSMGENWISQNKGKEQELLTTLAVLLAQALVEVLGKERTAVDFKVMANGHICIFDTNPGGAGYSIRLRTQETQQAVLRRAKTILDNARTRDALLDRNTSRFERLINLRAANDWFSNLKL